MSRIITISREFGNGGRELGKREHYDLRINTTKRAIKNLAQGLSGMLY